MCWIVNWYWCYFSSKNWHKIWILSSHTVHEMIPWSEILVWSITLRESWRTWIVPHFVPNLSMFMFICLFLTYIYIVYHFLFSVSQVSINPNIERKKKSVDLGELFSCHRGIWRSYASVFSNSFWDVVFCLIPNAWSFRQHSYVMRHWSYTNFGLEYAQGNTFIWDNFAYTVKIHGTSFWNETSYVQFKEGKGCSWWHKC